MGRKQLSHPYSPPGVKPLYYRLLTPATVGSLTAAMYAAFPGMPGTNFVALPTKVGVLTGLPGRAYVILLGFALGFSVSKGLGWARWKVLKALFSYQDWVHRATSTKTKAWAILVRLLKGPGPYSTYEFQRMLPSQPLPSLNQTLDTWLQVSSQILSKEDFQLTKEAVEIFRTNEGPKLQAHLESRAEREVNWLYDYWMNAAYLMNRDPIAINSNYYNCLHLPKSRSENQIARAATVVQLLAEFAEMIKEERLPPVELMNLIPLCMNGYRYLFNTVRLPGENVDTLARFPDRNHIVVIKDGHFFKLNLYSTNKDGEKTLLNLKEIKQQLLHILEETKDGSQRCDVAVLTTQNRTQWAKHREILMKKNQVTLNEVESAMFMLCLDDLIIDDLSLCCKRMLTGSGSDRWFDKGFTFTVLGNASGGHNIEHSAIDAMVYVSLSEYQCIYEHYASDGDIACSPDTPTRILPKPSRLQWNLDGMTDIVSSALTQYKQQMDNIDVYALKAPYGKAFMKKQRLSPDGYVQMAIQLAYYRKHKEMTKTYEPATGRLYALGRTETVHPISPYCSAWVKAMDDPLTSSQSQRALLRKAVEYQNNFRLKATVGQGCDRHLLGLYMASRELGMDVPAIFTDKAWRNPFKLSTSQTPTLLASYGPDMDYPACTGGFAPSCSGGYGISYVLHGDDILTVSITSWHKDEDTCSAGFAASLTQSMLDMKALYQK